MSSWAQAANDLDNIQTGGAGGDGIDNTFGAGGESKPTHRVSFSNVDQFSDQPRSDREQRTNYIPPFGQCPTGNVSAPPSKLSLQFGNAVVKETEDGAGNTHYLDNNPSNLYNIHLEDCNAASLVPFSAFGLKANLLKGIYQMGFNTPSKIQEICVPLLTKDPPQNMIAQSQSGTGKTATFVITMMERVDHNNPYTQCICIAPTFELVLQIGTVCEQISKYMGITVGYALRGVGVAPNANEPMLSQVVIATPGKLLEYCFKRQCIQLAGVKVCVLDEADVMIDQQGHREQTIRVISKLPKHTQMLLFSATFNDNVSDFATTVVPRAHTLKLRRSQESLHNIAQYYFNCKNIEEKFQAILNIYGTISLGQAMIFCQTRKNATWLATKLAENRLSCALLSGELDVSERASIIERFRSARERILVTTNVSARGIDVEQVTMVVNFDMPVIYDTKKADCETYLHRIGRTGRFGKNGIAINMIDGSRNMEIQKQIIEHFNIKILPLEINDLDAIARIEPNYIPT